MVLTTTPTEWTYDSFAISRSSIEFVVSVASNAGTPGESEQQPTLDEFFQNYRQLLRLMKNRPMILFRLFDFEKLKPLSSLEL